METLTIILTPHMVVRVRFGRLRPQLGRQFRIVGVTTNMHLIMRHLTMLTVRRSAIHVVTVTLIPDLRMNVAMPFDGDYLRRRDLSQATPSLRRLILGTGNRKHARLLFTPLNGTPTPVSLIGRHIGRTMRGTPNGIRDDDHLILVQQGIRLGPRNPRHTVIRLAATQHVSRVSVIRMPQIPCFTRQKASHPINTVHADTNRADGTTARSIPVKNLLFAFRQIQVRTRILPRLVVLRVKAGELIRTVGFGLDIRIADDTPHHRTDDVFEILHIQIARIQPGFAVRTARDGDGHGPTAHVLHPLVRKPMQGIRLVQTVQLHAFQPIDTGSHAISHEASPPAIRRERRP
nr:MAG TPA: hypothetical protein [Caudoviricetes sp.]